MIEWVVNCARGAVYSFPSIEAVCHTQRKKERKNERENARMATVAEASQYCTTDGHIFELH